MSVEDDIRNLITRENLNKKIKTLIDRILESLKWESLDFENLKINLRSGYELILEFVPPICIGKINFGDHIEIFKYFHNSEEVFLKTERKTFFYIFNDHEYPRIKKELECKLLEVS